MHRTSDRMVSVISALEPTFGGINLEDIKAPECFEVEAQLREIMNIPVFHDDQHGTAIIVAAGILNGLELAGKKLEDARSSPPAPARRRLPASTCWWRSARNARTSGSRHRGPRLRRPRSADGPVEIDLCAEDRQARPADVDPGADVFLGLSAAGVLKPEMLKEMAESR
jgi:malate dehydrogenase (oxaloacetate-decarboxylating)(NADP+)